MDREERRPVVGDSAAEVAMDDDGSSSSPASYIRLVQHLIEKCICYNMNKEECMETLEKHANVTPVITSTVWKELEKENREFFETYKKDRPGEESTQKNPSSSDEQAFRSAPNKSSDDADDEDQPSAPNKGSDDDDQPSAAKELRRRRQQRR